MKRTRALLTAALPAALAATLIMTGCSAGSDVNANCVPAGSASKSVKVDGDFGGDLTLTSETPVEVTEIERSVLIEGDGEAIVEGQTAIATVSMFNGNTGDLIEQAADFSIPNDEEQLTGAEWLLEGVQCAVEGQRAVIVTPATEVIGDDVEAAEIEDLGNDDSLVLVFDFTGFEAAPVECDTLTARDEKYPEVELGDGSEEPVITIPECMEPPTELEVEVLEEGDGAVVESDQTIMTNYVGVDWNGAERFDGSWTETGYAFSTAEGALIDGFRDAMIGQKIGSTILVTVPPELGYSDGVTRTFVLQLVSAADAQ